MTQGGSMWYNKFMNKHVTLRMDGALYSRVESEAKTQDRGVSWIIRSVLRERFPDKKTKGERKCHTDQVVAQAA